jgi:uncharacterized protein
MSLVLLTYVNGNFVAEYEIEVLLVGSGVDAKFFPTEIEQAIKQKRISIEYMNTGAASRTYNILLTEERKVAVVLIAV